MMFKVTIQFGEGKRKIYEFEEEFKDLSEESVIRATAWFRDHVDNYNMRGGAFIELSNGEEFDMTFNVIDPDKRCNLSGITVPADVYRTKTLTTCFHETLTALRIEHTV